MKRPAYTISLEILIFAGAIWNFIFPVFFNSLGTRGTFTIIGFQLVYSFTIIIVFKLKVPRDISILPYLTYFFYFVISIPFSMTVGVLFGGVQLNIRDFIDLYRPILYFMFFLLTLKLMRSKPEFSKIEKTGFIVFLILVSFGTAQISLPLDEFFLMYTKKINIYMGRITVPFLNPYDYAFVMTFFVYWFLYKSIYQNFAYSIFCCIGIILIILTQSRSVFVGHILSLLFIVPLQVLLPYRAWNKVKYARAILLTFLFILLIVCTLYMGLGFINQKAPYLINSLTKVIEGGGIGTSASLRLSQFNFAWDKATGNFFIFLFGNGPSKNELELVESIYTYMFYRFGLLGALLYVFLIVYSILSAAKNAFCGTLPSEVKIFSMASMTFFVLVLIVSIGNNFTEQVRISFFFYGLIGLTAGITYLRKQQRL